MSSVGSTPICSRQEIPPHRLQLPTIQAQGVTVLASIVKRIKVQTVIKLGKNIIANLQARFKIYYMGKNNQYDPAVYKRLELVRKQFQSSTAEQKKREKTERRQQLLDSLIRNRTRILRLATYIGMSLLVLAVIAVVIIERI